MGLFHSDCLYVELSNGYRGMLGLSIGLNIYKWKLVRSHYKSVMIVNKVGIVLGTQFFSNNVVWFYTDALIKS